MKKITTILFIGLTVSVSLTNCSGNSMEEKSNSNSESQTNTSESTSEETMSEKKKVLTSLIGEHKLQSISGAMGMNGMFDYTKNAGKWSATESALSMGMREAYDVDLSKNDLKHLNSMAITVGDDLSVSLMSNGKEFFKTSFNENGLGYFLKNSPEDYISGVPEKLTPETTFLDGSLYLFAKDFISENDMNKINITSAYVDAAMLSYNTKSKQFELSLFLGECCDNATYFFK
jgi:hypothetical protein